MSEREYFQRRAAEEFERAVQASDPQVAAIHAALAGEYDRKSEQARTANRGPL